MKNVLKFSSLLLVLVALVLQSCNRRDDSPLYTSGPAVQSKVNASVIGRVVDDNHQPVINAVVTLNGKNTKTDADGFFIYNKSEMTGPYAFVKVEKSGFFNGSRTFTVTKDRTHYVNIQLLPLTIRGSFPASLGGEVSFDGVTVKIPANGVMSTNGVPYFGTVKLAGQYLSPTDIDLQQIMPGDLIGNLQVGVQRLLKTWGMVGVELIGEQGQKLQIMTGMDADLEMPVAPTQAASAPTHMPLWHFDETKGFWVEEGHAELVNGKFVGKVKHFSFWNCDTPQAANITLDFTIVDPNGNPLANMYVTLTSANYGTRSGVTDNLGHVGGLIPNNETLQLAVYANYNGTNCLIHQSTVGPFLINTNLGNIPVMLTGTAFSSTYSGTVTDCNGLPVTYGAVKATFGGTTQLAIVNAGTYSFTFVSCAAGLTADFIAEDYNAFVTSPILTTTIVAGNQTQNLSACGAAIPEYIQQTENGIPTMFTTNISCSDSSSGGTTTLFVNAQGTSGGGTVGYISYSITENAGVYTVPSFFAYTNAGGGTNVTYTVSGVTVTSWPTATGQFLDCVITGTYVVGGGGGPFPFTTTSHVELD